MGRQLVFQYQAKAEPILVETPVESVTLDKWYSPASEPVRRRRPAPPSSYVFPFAAIGVEFTSLCTPWLDFASADSGISGTIVWSNPSNALTDNSADASAAMTGFSASEYLQVQNCSPGLPSTAIISSVSVRVDKTSAGGGVVNLTDIQLMSGVFDSAASLKGDPDSYNGTNFFGSSSAVIFGGAGDTWSGYLSSLTAAIVNASDFGVALKATNVSGTTTIGVDSIQIKFCYSVPATITVDMWYAPASEPVRAPPPLRTSEIVTAPLWVPVIDQPVALDSWYAPASEPVRTFAPRPHGGTTDPTFAANQGSVAVNLDSWFMLASEPVRQEPRFRQYDKGENYEPSLFVEPDFNSWYAPASEPVRVAPPRREDWFAIPPQYQTEAPALDAWWLPSPEPPLPHKPRPHGDRVVPLGVEPPHSRHDWLLPIEQPIRTRAKLNNGIVGMTVIDPMAFLHNPISWYYPPSVPRWELLKQRKRVYTDNGYFSPADWNTLAELEPDPIPGRLICGSIETYPRMDGTVEMSSRVDATVEISPRMDGAGIVIRCNCC